jgi:probable F420-dependent oxidoreductase
MDTAQSSLSAARTRALRFAVGGPADVRSRAELVDHVQEAERLGFDVVTFPDHLFLGLDPVVAMTVAAQVSRRVRVATFMLAAGLRNPVLLAKQLASLDVASDGRLEVGIGAGWSGEDFLACGLPFEGPGERIIQLEEVIAVLRGIWLEPDFSYAGRKVLAQKVPGVPATIQPGGPPVLVGGGGRRILTLAGRCADTVTIMGRPIGGGNGLPGRAALEERVGWVTSAADSVQRQPELHVLLSHVAVCADRREGARELCASWPAEGGERPRPEDVLSCPFIVLGSLEEIAEQVLALRADFGISYFNVRSTAAQAMGPVIGLLSGR